MKLISTRGYLGATTKEIAKTAGVAEPTLFRHFASKEGLFEEVLKRNSFLTVLRELIPEIAGMPYEKAMVEIAKRLLQVLTSRKKMIKIMHSEMGRYPEKIQEIYHSFMDEMTRTLASYFNDLIKTGRLREFDTELGARAFFGMFFSYFTAEEFLMRKKHRSPDSERVVREFVRIFVRGTFERGAEESEE